MSRRLVFLCACALAATAAHAHAATRQPSSWAAPSIRTVNAAGLLGGAKDVASFRPDDALTAQELETLVVDLQARLAPEPSEVASPTRPVPLWELDARLVAALGLSDAASSFAQGARAAGLTVPARFGTEVVARLLGLRLNHPADEDALELRPQDVATRAEAAYSVARILRLSAGEAAGVESAAASFALPALSAWQQRILATAVAKIGMPYVWGGESDTAQTVLGVQSKGGYDCSGFVRRVYTLQSYPGEGSLASTLRGRTTYALSGEVPAAKRIAFAALRPADVVFFGDRGPRSKPAQIGHMGIYLGNGWFIHSSESGVALAPMTGWYRTEFAWARRPLAEAAPTFEG